MDNKKFEQLIDLIINENEEQARALFHDIVVEKSREIYESLMDDEMVDSPVEGLMDEISAEEQGMTEEEEELSDIEVADDGEDLEGEVELGADEFGDEEGEGELEDRVVDLEDKLDELMAEFEELMGQEGGEEDFGGEEGGEEDFGGDDEDMMESADDEEETVEESADDEEEGEETLEESVQLQKVPTAKMGDNGQNTKSPTLGSNSKVSSNGAKPVSAGFQDSGKGGTQGGLLNPTPKDIPGNYKNAPGAKFSEKGEAAPKPKHGDDGQNSKSIVGEGKKLVKKPVAAKPVAKKIVK
jgi:hypothetical protein